ncbi:tyrosine-type recombinase/integrase [Escherichia coli]|uniref:Integrase n=43 Tax=Enterobacteriaceae TaxID=543 RepID=A0A0H3JG90_ECO57|nr:site-specific integrase [Escherichia coli]NP_311539.1 integrase [Escherichia coli O157:H7 str. Sakai]EET3382024.1 site-specific integrase [Escherichia coli O111]EET3530212.1 site-specific integrase [Escherichia coli O157:NM]EFW4743663.1 site-specific integrase [Shigella sonnei]EHU68240.1 phage integrase family protein [Escherichia coli DEC3C]EHV05031.1 phage integrase family protein [Escherichia coli DEC4C]EHV10036.1 phage integrase family protein [Escherichia coli DEC4E]EHY1723293.1 sit
MGYKVKKFIMSSGERGCLILDKKSNLPTYYQNLFLTTDIRNRGATASTMEIVATNLLIFSNFLDGRGIDIIERVELKKYLSVAEIDDLVRYAKQRFDRQKIINIKSTNYRFIAKRTFSYRIHVFSRYLKWLCGLVHSSKGIHAKYEVDVFIESIRAHIPRNSSLNMNEISEKSLNEEEIKVLFRLLEIGGIENPFHKEVQVRNRLIFTLLLNLGLRAGELLNLKIDDFDLRDNTLSVVRRHDSKEDGRSYQPLVKTGERVIPLSDELAREIFDYISNSREKMTKRKKHNFLFVAHCTGKNAGEPLSISAYEKVISTLKRASPELYNLSGHRLRHSWNYMYSKGIEGAELEYNRRKDLRNYLMGWSKESIMCDRYNYKYISQQEKDVVLKVYKSVSKIISGV